MSEIPAWLDTELLRANGTVNAAQEPHSKKGRRLTDAQQRTVRRLIRERLRANPNASGAAFRRDVARKHDITISESWWSRRYWNPICKELRIAPAPQRGPSAVEDSRIRGFIRDRLVDDPTLSGRAVLRMVRDELGIKVRERSWYRRYWRPTLERLGLKVREPGFGPARASHDTPDTHETAVEGSEPESPSTSADHGEPPVSNAHSGTTTPSSAPAAPPTDGNGAALPEWRRSFEHVGPAGGVVVRERRKDRCWRIDIDAWVDEETARAVFERVGAVID